MVADTITLTIADYEDLIDSREAAIVANRLARNEEEVLTGEQVDAYLAAPTPVVFWRQHRGLMQVELAAKADISQPYLAQIESGTRTGTVAVYVRLAKALRTRIEDLLEEQRDA